MCINKIQTTQQLSTTRFNSIPFTSFQHPNCVGPRKDKTTTLICACTTLYSPARYASENSNLAKYSQINVPAIQILTILKNTSKLFWFQSKVPNEC